MFLWNSSLGVVWVGGRGHPSQIIWNPDDLCGEATLAPWAVPVHDAGARCSGGGGQLKRTQGAGESPQGTGRKLSPPPDKLWIWSAASSCTRTMGQEARHGNLFRRLSWPINSALRPIPCRDITSKKAVGGRKWLNPTHCFIIKSSWWRKPAWSSPTALSPLLFSG